jgi:predicted aspartyl protease
MRLCRPLVLLLFCASLGAADLGQLQEFTEKNRLFDLRRALEQPGRSGAEVLFYEAVAAARFGRETEGIELFRKVLAAKPGSGAARKAHEEMATAFQRLGRYKEAAQAWTQALLLTPKDDLERAENENARDLMESLSDVAAQTVEFGGDAPIQASRNRLGTWDVPLQVNNVKSQWIMDTGADLSTLTESEARRMGLSVRQAKAWVGGSTGEKNPLRLAVASNLQFGPARLHNVVFLVLADQALNIEALQYQIAGILGLPVLRALTRLAVSNTGAIEIHPRERTRAGAPNLFFDEASPIVEISRGEHRLQMFLDTGANSSVLYPSFRKALGPEETSKLETKQGKTAGAGGMVERKTEVVPTLRIQVLETPIDLKKVRLLAETPPGRSRYRDGMIGMNALWSGFLLDFDAMKLEVR